MISIRQRMKQAFVNIIIWKAKAGNPKTQLHYIIVM